MSILQTISSPADVKKLSIEQLEVLASEIRSTIIGQIQKTGGHLAPNLGVVELTLAMHYVFDFSSDRLLFDVGHQCYPHKLITGRLELFDRLRTREGMSGFPEPLESEYDLFRVGHAGTGISTAVGMARGDTLMGEGFDPKSNPAGRRVVALVGDGSIVNGVALEGLNNAGTLNRQLLVVLNDNGMSISKPQGALAQYFDRVRVSHTYSDFKKGAAEILRHIPGGRVLKDAYHRAGELTKVAITEDSLFEKFGLLTVGPIDGHHLPTLIEFLHEARDMNRPMVLHVKTVKGKGLDVAEADATAFHAPKAFTVERDEVLGCRVEIQASGRSFTSAFGEAMADLMERDEKIVCATAAMADGTGIAEAIKRVPERSFDTGICESHAMDMLAGMAKSGLKPFFAVYSTFVQRAFDQAFQEVALQGLGVRLCLDRAGLVGGDGAVHHGFCDISILRALPGAVLTAAIDEPSLKAALDFMAEWDEGLSCVRYPRDSVSNRLSNKTCPAFELGKARALTPAFLDLDESKPDLAVLAYGTPAISALEAAEQLEGEYKIAVWDARFAKPIDAELVQGLLSREIPILTLEDHTTIGGFGSAVIEAASHAGLNAGLVTRGGLPDRWVLQNSRASQLKEVGLDAEGIARQIRIAADRSAPTSPTSSVGTAVSEPGPNLAKCSTSENAPNLDPEQPETVEG